MFRDCGTEPVKRRQRCADDVAEYFPAGCQLFYIMLPAETQVHVSHEQNESQNQRNGVFPAHSGAYRGDDPAEESCDGQSQKRKQKAAECKRMTPETVAEYFMQ